MTHLPLYPSDFLIACSLLLLSATFSCSESVLFALPRYVVRRLGENPHHPITRLLSDQRRLLSILLVGNMFVNLLFSAFALLVALRFFPSYSAFVLAELIAFVALVIFGEMTPKFVALLSPVFMSKLVAYPLLYISFILRIPAKVLDKTARLFTSPLARRVKKGEDDRLISLIRGAEQDRIIDPYEAQLLGQILRLRDKRVRQIVTPRMRVVGCDINTPRSDILKILQETGYRKLPVFDKDIENILGILHAKDIYLYPHLEVKELIRKPIFVPDRQPLDLFLRTLIARSETHAIVVDEYGSVVGLATLEDAVEEIIGEIEDEHDRSQAKIQFLETGRYLVSGECDIGIWEQV
ncbi:MAG: CNNM domain-containing protein, partial [Planctomycetota bacterium]|nr:CNNM domain-containing protein [Planctomycetota bacterium]